MVQFPSFQINTILLPGAYRSCHVLKGIYIKCMIRYNIVYDYIRVCISYGWCYQIKTINNGTVRADIHLLCQWRNILQP